MQANLSHRLSIDQFVVGLTLNLFVLGLALFLDSRWEAVTSVAKPTRVPLLSDIPLVGDALFGQPWPMYLIVPVVPFAWWLVFHTRWGLEVRSVGDNPQAADVSGIAVNRRRRQAIMFAGLASGSAGACWCSDRSRSRATRPGHVGLKGIIAIAAVIFGGWTLRGTIIGCLLFGYFFALAADAAGAGPPHQRPVGRQPSVRRGPGHHGRVRHPQPPAALARAALRPRPDLTAGALRLASRLSRRRRGSRCGPGRRSRSIASRTPSGSDQPARQMRGDDQVVELLERARADDRRGDRRVVEHEGERELLQRESRLGGDRRQLVDQCRASRRG